MRFQFQVDGRPARPARKEWHEAAEDAVNAGFASWNEPYLYVIFGIGNGEIVRIEEDKK